MNIKEQYKQYIKNDIRIISSIGDFFAVYGEIPSNEVLCQNDVYGNPLSVTRESE